MDNGEFGVEMNQKTQAEFKPSRQQKVWSAKLTCQVSENVRDLHWDCSELNTTTKTT